MSKTAEKAGAPEALETVEVPIRAIRVEEQHRRYFDDKKIKELAGSIEKVGVLQPILLRQDPEDHSLYLLVAGERRLRAAKLAGLEEIRAQVGEWDDQAAAEIQALENLHRADLTPIEEARAFKTLKDVGNHDVETLAERVDKSVAYVYRALALIELPAPLIKLIEAGEMTPAHGHQLLRLPAEDRLKVYEEWQDDWTSKEADFTAKSLREFIERHADKDLDRAIFPKDKPYAGQVGCVGCPFNSANQGDLFDGAQKGRCTKPACFDTKTNQARQDVADKALAGTFKGLTFAGVAERDYRGLQFNGAVEVDPAMTKDKKLAQLIQEKPEKFAIVVAKENYDHKKPEAVLVCKDPPLLRRLLPKAEKKRERAFDSSIGGPSKTAREKFVEAEIEKAFFEASAKATNVQKESFWKIVLDNVGSGASHRYIWERLGISDDADEGKLWKMDRQKWFETILLLSISPYGHVSKSFLKDLGVKAADVEKKARAAAAKAWDEKKAGKTKEGRDAEDGRGESEEQE